MKPKTMILAVVAIGCGLAASYMTSKLLADKKGPPPEEKVQIVVATKNVPKQTLLKDPSQFFEIRERTKSEAPTSYFGTLEEIQGKRLSKDVKQDTHLSPDDLTEKATTALPIPEGFGALSIKVTATSAVGYFVFPGDKVDLILTERGEHASSQTILRDVLVLSVGAVVVKSTEEGATTTAQQANNVCVALTPDEAQLVRLAEVQGELSLYLRRDGDENKDTGGVTTPAHIRQAVKNLARKKEPATNENLPFGWNLEELPERKTDDRRTDVAVQPEPVKPEWRVSVRHGDDVRTVDFFKQGAETTVEEQPGQPKKPEKKPQPQPEKKPAAAPTGSK